MVIEMLSPRDCLPLPRAIYMFEIVKKMQNLSPCQDQMSGERDRTVGPLVKLLNKMSQNLFDLEPWYLLYSFGMRSRKPD